MPPEKLTLIFQEEILKESFLTSAGKLALKAASGLGKGAASAGKAIGKGAVSAGKTIGREAGTLGKQAAQDALEAGKSSLADKALSVGGSALDVLSGGADEEEDGSWSSKLANMGGFVGSTAGGLAGGIGGAGVGSIPLGLAGGAAGGFLGRKLGKALGGIIDRYSSGDTSAVGSLAKLIIGGALPATGLGMFAKNYLEDSDSSDFSNLLSAAKNKLPKKYHDEVDDAIDTAEADTEEDTEEDDDSFV